VAFIPPRPRFSRRPDGAPTYRRGRWWPAWALLALPFVVLMAVLLPVVRRRVHWMACAFTVLVFEAVMLPVEHWSILRGHWVYNESRILGPLVWGIPIEEPLIYYLLPPILVIMIHEYLAGRITGAIPRPDWSRIVRRWRASTPGTGPASYWSGRAARGRAPRRPPMHPTSPPARRRPTHAVVRFVSGLAWPLALLLAAAAPAGLRAAEPPPAVLEEVTGDVVVIRGAAKTEIDGEEDLPLKEGDTVRTGAGARATISFRDAHLVRLAERSALVIRTLKPATTGFFGAVRLAAGKLFASLAPLVGAGSGFRVETRTAVAAVKGTTFSVEDAEDGSTVAVLEGTVSTAGLDDAGAEIGAVDVGEGQETAVSVKGRRPGAPRRFLDDGRRAELRERLRDLRGHAGTFREAVRSGEHGRGRKMRNLARAGALLDLEREDPDAWNDLPEDRRAEIRAFLDEHREDVNRRGPEVREFLARHPELKAKLRAQAERRLRRHGGRPHPRPAPAKPRPHRKPARDR
jgi:lycopene cyclase domain-containing protein